MSADPFDNAVFYDACDNSDHLTLESPEEALEGFFDRMLDAKLDTAGVESVIRANSPVEVKAYARTVVPQEQRLSYAQDLVEKLEEQWSEEYGSPDDDSLLADHEELVTALLPWIDLALSKGTVWQCDVVATRIYTGDECVALLREQTCWFDEHDAKTGGG